MRSKPDPYIWAISGARGSEFKARLGLYSGRASPAPYYFVLRSCFMLLILGRARDGPKKSAHIFSTVVDHAIYIQHSRVSSLNSQVSCASLSGQADCNHASTQRQRRACSRAANPSIKQQGPNRAAEYGGGRWVAATRDAQREAPNQKKTRWKSAQQTSPF